MITELPDVAIDVEMPIDSSMHALPTNVFYLHVRFGDHSYLQKVRKIHWFLPYSGILVIII